MERQEGDGQALGRKFGASGAAVADSLLPLTSISLLLAHRPPRWDGRQSSPPPPFYVILSYFFFKKICAIDGIHAAWVVSMGERRIEKDRWLLRE